MAKASPIITSFNGGELSPLIAGRVDVAKYANGMTTMQGFLPSVQGPALSRPGFKFVGEAKDSNDRGILIRFEFSTEDSYMLEFGDGFIRFKKNRAVLVTGSVTAWSNATAYVVGDLAEDAGVNYYCILAHTNQAPPNATYWYALTDDIYEIPSPYAVADLTDADGAPLLCAVQTGDVVYLFHGEYFPRKLSRFGATDWVLEQADFNPPPFKAQNDTTTTMYVSARTGTGVTLTASAATFDSGMVGQYVYLEEKSVRDTKMWEAGKAIALNDLRRSDGKNYKALNAATTGGVKPVHSEGAAYDGDAGVQWQVQDAGAGWVKITGYTSTTVVTVDVISDIPDGAVLVANATTRWALQAWNDDDGYPETGTFFRERLVCARDATVWFTVAADFENFATKIDGEIVADAGFERTLASERVNNIRWMQPSNVLLVGTSGDEWAIAEQTASEAFGPGNAQTKRQSTYGSGYVPPARVGDVTLFVQKSARKLRAMAFRFEEDGFKSDDATVYSNHLMRPGIIDIAYQQEPLSLVWCAKSDGGLVALTFNREQDVVAWTDQPLSGGEVESVECIPNPNGDGDDLWIIAKYTIDGNTKRYIAYLTDIEHDGEAPDDQADWFYVDMGLTYDGAPTTTITGLDHLEGEVVQVLADGANHPDRTVASGSITLQLAASVVQVGLPNLGTLYTLSLNNGSAEGTSQGKTKRVHEVVVRVLNSLGGKAGPDADNLEEMQGRDPSVPMGSAPEPYTGDIIVPWPGGYTLNARLMIKRNYPMPIHVVALMPKLQTQD